MDINYIYDKLLEIDPNFKKFVEEHDNLSNKELLTIINEQTIQRIENII